MEQSSENTRLRRPRLVYDVELLRSMADESRMKILQFLCTPGAGEMLGFPVFAIAEATGMSLSTTSHHLQILKRSGLVDMERRGRERYYSMQFDNLRTSIVQFRDLIHFIDKALERGTPVA